MAVYTKLKQEEINNILLNYKLGKLNKFEGIKEGIENTNYSIQTEKGKYILTIYERRVKETDLPFFSNLMVELSKNGFVCPKPIANKDNNYISDFNDKKFMIVSFLDGKSKVIYHHLNARLLETKLQECIKLQKILNSQGIMIYQLDLGEVFFLKLRTNVIKFMLSFQV